MSIEVATWVNMEWIPTLINVRQFMTSHTAFARAACVIMVLLINMVKPNKQIIYNCVYNDTLSDCYLTGSISECPINL